MDRESLEHDYMLQNMRLKIREKRKKRTSKRRMVERQKVGMMEAWAGVKRGGEGSRA